MWWFCTHRASKMNTLELDTRLSCRWADWWTTPALSFNLHTMPTWCPSYWDEWPKRLKSRWKLRLLARLFPSSPILQALVQETRRLTPKFKKRVKKSSCNTVRLLFKTYQFSSNFQSTRRTRPCKKRLLCCFHHLPSWCLSYLLIITEHSCQDWWASYRIRPLKLSSKKN